MVDLITKGAPYVRYTNESRMIAVIAISPMENCALNFIGYVDAFVGERKRLNLREFEGLSILYAALSPLSAELAARDNAGDMKQLKQIASEAGRFLIEEMRKYHGSEHQHIGFLQAFTQELQKRSRLFWERDASYTT
jgi:hypothetical protein